MSCGIANIELMWRLFKLIMYLTSMPYYAGGGPPAGNFLWGPVQPNQASVQPNRAPVQCTHPPWANTGPPDPTRGLFNPSNSVPRITGAHKPPTLIRRLLAVKGSQLKWFRQASDQDASGTPPLEVFQERPSEWRLRGRPRARWRD